MNTKFRDCFYYELGASRSNANPDNLVTKLYADQIYKYLIKKKYITNNNF